jgi:DNA repair protein RecO (recombination protein O)
MAKLLRTEAIALHSIPFAESSKIVTFYTRDFGKLNFLAKGARRPRSKFGAALETFTYAKLILYKPETPKLYILSDAEIIRPFARLQTTAEHYFAGEKIVNFVLRAVDFEEPNARLFNLVLKALTTLAETNGITDNLVLAFFLKAASFLGYRPELENCIICRKALAKMPKEIFFANGLGGILCPDCKTKSPEVVCLSQKDVIQLQALLYLPLQRSLNLKHLKPELVTLILQYLNHHLEKLDLTDFNQNNVI